MTSSATQTSAGPDGGLRERVRRWTAARSEPLATAGLVTAGWLLILAINRWHLGAPAVFLCLGWLAIVAAGRLLWIAAMRAGTEMDGGPDEIEAVTETRASELEREKKTLLKAIKEVEFDRELGKMSDEDAGEIVRVYRARAIEILKLLDGGEAAVDEAARIKIGEPIDEVIEREVRARLALAGVGAKIHKKAKKAEAHVSAEKPATHVSADKPATHVSADKPPTHASAEKSVAQGPEEKADVDAAGEKAEDDEAVNP